MYKLPQQHPVSCRLSSLQGKVEFDNGIPHLPHWKGKGTSHSLLGSRVNLNKGLIPQDPLSGLKDNYKQTVNPHEMRMNSVSRPLTLCSITATRRVCIRLYFHLRVSGMHLKYRLAQKASCTHARVHTTIGKFVCPSEEYTEIHQKAHSISSF